MKITLKELATLVGGELIGSPTVVIAGASGIKEAKAGDITFLANIKYASLLQKTNASAVITSRDVAPFGKPIIRVDNPSWAFAQVINLITQSKEQHFKGIHPTAIISPTVKLGSNVAIGPYVVIGENVTIGDNTIVYPYCFIGDNSKLGAGCLIYPNVSIRENITIGNKAIIHSGAVIGSDGFGFAQVNGVQEKIPQIGTVVIEDDVEIGANVTIARARFDKTFIGKGSKIDNLVQIAHNVIIGNNCLIVSQAGISGSTTIGNNAILAGQCGLVGHIEIGEGAIIAAQAGVTKSVPAKTQVSGYPAKPHETARKINACVQSLPLLYKKVKDLEKKISELEDASKKNE